MIIHPKNTVLSGFTHTRVFSKRFGTQKIVLGRISWGFPHSESELELSSSNNVKKHQKNIIMFSSLKMSFQTGLTFFLLWNPKDDVLNNILLVFFLLWKWMGTGAVNLQYCQKKHYNVFLDKFALFSSLKPKRWCSEESLVRVFLIVNVKGDWSCQNSIMTKKHHKNVKKKKILSLYHICYIEI